MTADDAMSMYMQTILEYYKNPVNYGEIKNPTIHFHESNPTCGDIIDVYIKLEGETITSFTFTGKGCAISQAASSMLTETMQGKSIQDLKKVRKNEIMELIGVEVSAARMKCALLSLRAAKQGLMQYLLKRGEKINKDDFKVYE